MPTFAPLKPDQRLVPCPLCQRAMDPRGLPEHLRGRDHRLPETEVQRHLASAKGVLRHQLDPTALGLRLGELAAAIDGIRAEEARLKRGDKAVLGRLRSSREALERERAELLGESEPQKSE